MALIIRDVDFLFTYEVRNRELDSICLLGAYLEKKGKLDSGKIEVVLTDWDKPYNIVTNDEEFIDGATDPHVIGRGYLNLDKDTGDYIHFDIPIDYRSGKTPKYVVIIVAASNLGDYFTGGEGSQLKVDDFKLIYE